MKKLDQQLKSLKWRDGMAEVNAKQTYRFGENLQKRKFTERIKGVNCGGVVDIQGFTQRNSPI